MSVFEKIDGKMNDNDSTRGNKVGDIGGQVIGDKLAGTLNDSFNQCPDDRYEVLYHFLSVF